MGRLSLYPPPIEEELVNLCPKSPRNASHYCSKINSIPADATMRPVDDLPSGLFTRIARWTVGPLLEIFPANYIYDIDDVTGEQVKLPCWTVEQIDEKLRRSAPPPAEQ